MVGEDLTGTQVLTESSAGPGNSPRTPLTPNKGGALPLTRVCFFLYFGVSRVIIFSFLPPTHFPYPLFCLVPGQTALVFIYIYIYIHTHIWVYKYSSFHIVWPLLCLYYLILAVPHGLQELSSLARDRSNPCPPTVKERIPKTVTCQGIPCVFIFFNFILN